MTFPYCTKALFYNGMDMSATLKSCIEWHEGLLQVVIPEVVVNVFL